MNNMTIDDKLKMFTCWQFEALQQRQINDSIDCFVAKFEPAAKTAKDVSRGMVKFFDCVNFVINNIHNATIFKHSLQGVTLLKVVITNNQGAKVVYNFNAGTLHDVNDKKIELSRPFAEVK